MDTKQLDWGLGKDPRVVPIEKNARELSPADIPEAPGIVTMDVSFISVLKILPALKAIPGEWTLVSLIKPQFEAAPKDVGRKGVIRDAEVHAEVLARVIAGARETRLRPQGPHPLLDARPEGERRILCLVGQGDAGPQRGPRPSLDQGGGQP